jgi:hypothetical protein
MKQQSRFGIPHQLGYFAGKRAIGNSDSRKIGIGSKIDIHCTSPGDRRFEKHGNPNA